MMWVWSVHMVHTHSLTHLDRYSSYLHSYETSSESKLDSFKEAGPYHKKCHLGGICYEEVLGHEEVGGGRGKREHENFRLKCHSCYPSEEGVNRFLGVNTN